MTLYDVAINRRQRWRQEGIEEGRMVRRMEDRAQFRNEKIAAG